MDRVVSLAPSVTATLVALGAADRLVGITRHGDLGSSTSPETVERVGGWLTPDVETLAALDPDLVLTADPLQSELATDLRGAGYRVVHQEPRTLDDVLLGIEETAEVVGEAAAGERLAAAARRRVERCRAIAAGGDGAPRPVVYCEEWPDPPMAAGNWVPDVVEAAGGRYPFGEPGERSAPVDAETVRDADPDHVVVHYCGRGAVEPPDFRRRWGLGAKVTALDDALLNQPSPRLLDGLERLTALLNDIPLEAVKSAGAPTG